MLKEQLRLDQLDLRKNLPGEFRHEGSRKIAQNALQIPVWEFRYFHIFLSIDQKAEVLTEPLIRILQQKKKHVIIPKMAKHASLKHILFRDDVILKKNSWGIPEPVNGKEIAPKQIEVVFLPLLGFDLKGNRVGYGGGYYDRFLEENRQAVKIGLSFFPPVDLISDVSDHDIPMDYCISPDKVYTFGDSVSS